MHLLMLSSQWTGEWCKLEFTGETTLENGDLTPVEGTLRIYLAQSNKFVTLATTTLHWMMLLDE